VNSRYWTLAKRPPPPWPDEATFALKETPVPTPGPGQALTRTIYVSLQAVLGRAVGVKYEIPRREAFDPTFHNLRHRTGVAGCTLELLAAALVAPLIWIVRCAAPARVVWLRRWWTPQPAAGKKCGRFHRAKAEGVVWQASNSASSRCLPIDGRRRPSARLHDPPQARSGPRQRSATPWACSAC
jgi:hypothetical protein